MAVALASVARPFRERYLSYADLEAQLRAWADAYPDLVRLTTLGKTTEGRDLWLLTLGKDPDRARPSVLVDANMHATELCGSSVALAIAEDFLRLHPEPDAALHALPAHAQRLREILVHVVPRMSPDGAETILSTARYVPQQPARRAPEHACTRGGSPPTSTATASRSRCASRTRAASSWPRPRWPASCCPAASRTRARSTRCGPRARSRTSTARRCRTPTSSATTTPI